MGAYSAPRPGLEGEEDDGWVVISLQWLLRVFLPMAMTLGPKVSFLALRDQLAWATVMHGPDMLNLALTLSTAALVDLSARMLPVPRRLWRPWVFGAIGVFVFLFGFSGLFRTVHGFLETGLIENPSDLLARERAEIAGLLLSTVLIAFSVIVAVAERRLGLYRKRRCRGTPRN